MAIHAAQQASFQPLSSQPSSSQRLDSQPLTYQQQGTGRHAQAAARLAIIIDDIGYNLALGQRAVDLPGPITYGVLPHTPLANKLSQRALRRHPDKEIIIHMPMQSLHGKRLGPGGLLGNFDRNTFLETLRDALQQLPDARGLSNHMGSYLTTLPDRMQWLMAELQQHGLFYLDSKTTTLGMARDAANDSRVPYLARDVFLDHDPSPKAIERAFSRAKQLARRKGMAVVVAHPYRSTLDFLEQQLPQLAAEGFAQVNASTAINVHNNVPRLAKRP
ncbi:MAG: divergent polysaccharide deacetylase family protein [Gammaproteobacteria bacterium]|nr:divergent polysaccharide deacetylase family protein [Gammaproteobacteria bacterium]